MALFLGLACAGDRTGLRARVGVHALANPAGPESSLPRLSVAPGGAVVLSWVEATSRRSGTLRFARLAPDSDRFGPARSAARGDDWFLNWADTPGVTAGAGDLLAAHWLSYLGEGTYAYGVRVSLSRDGGRTFDPPHWLHDDARPVEHGFVSLAPRAGGFGALWLDGRDGSTGSHGAMGLRFRRLFATGAPGPERLLDRRVCDCCATSLAGTPSGFLAAYRDRSEAEIRDVSVAELDPDGTLSFAPEPVHDDGWFLAGCPVNGPVLATRDDRAACAWYSGAQDGGRVLVSVRTDGVFSEPVRVDDGLPEGRVGLTGLADGRWLVTWLEHDQGSRGDWLARLVSRDGELLGESLWIASVVTDRASGFLVTAAHAEGAVCAWTDVDDGAGPRVHSARLSFLP